MTGRARVGVLVSGGGSNLQALLDACAQPAFPAEIAVVVSNVATAYALERAKKAHVPGELLDHKRFENRDAFEHALIGVLDSYGVEWICLAGFMRLLSSTFLSRYRGRVLNIHPALLPAFPGMHGVRQALEHGAKLAGCTVHFVDEGTDTGPIIAQAAVPVLPGDDEKTLAARVLAEEHRIYPLALELVASGRARVDGRRVVVDAPAAQGALSLRNPGRA